MKERLIPATMKQAKTHFYKYTSSVLHPLTKRALRENGAEWGEVNSIPFIHINRDYTLYFYLNVAGQVFATTEKPQVEDDEDDSTWENEDVTL